MTTLARRAAKRLAMTVGPVRELVRSRQILLAERDDAVGRGEQHRIERERAEAERDEALARARCAAQECEDFRILNDSLGEEIKEVRKVAQDAFDTLHSFGEGPPFVPNGHFYSPIPSSGDFERHTARIFNNIGRTLPGIDLNENGQIELLNAFRELYEQLPFCDEKSGNLRYYYRNPAYGHSDAIFLNLILRHAKPKRVLEIGSGFSSCMLLDTNELWFDNSIACTFIEPFPELLNSLLKEGDSARVDIIPTGVQDVDTSLFETLQANDVLFVDSTHVSKFGSDVNHIIFNILPTLASGVFVHFHDIFFPFEYPEQWIKEGRAWNEAYMLRAFLQHNTAYEVVMFNTFVQRFHRDFFEKNMPLCLENPGASIWLRKR